MDVLSVSPRWRGVGCILAVTASAAAVAFWFFSAPLPSVPQRTLRIGFESNPPVQIRTEDGFSGLAVETVDEAAKRAGIKLEWVETGTSSDQAFQEGLVDLWPLMVDFPERRKRVHFARPWMHSSDVLLVREDSPSPDRRFKGRIAVFKIPLHVKLAQEQFPEAHLAVVPEIEDVLQQVCRGAAAGFLEARVALTLLREQPQECSSVALRIQTIPGLVFNAGLASTFESAGAADQIQSEIDSMFRNGILATLIAKYSYFGLDDTWASYEQAAAEEKWRWLTGIIVFLVFALVLTLWQVSSLKQRKRAEVVLRESESRCRLAMEIGRMVAFEWDPSTDEVRRTYGYAGIFDLNGNETREVGKDSLQRIHPDDREHVIQAVKTLTPGKDSYRTEYRVSHPSGKIVTMQQIARARFDGDGRMVRLVGMVADITERKRAEDELRESQQRLVSIYNTVEDAIFHLAIEPEGQFRIVSVNAAFLRVTGLSQDQVVGKTVSEVIPEPSLTMVLGKYRKAIEEGTVVRWEETSDYPAGRVSGEVSVAPVFDNTGACTHLVGSVHDITEVKRAQEIEIRLASDLERSRDEVRALAASLVKAQEDERRRISRELHDQICHQLGSLAADIGNLADNPLAPKNLRAHLTAIRARAVKASQETHDIAYQMHTAILHDLGLVASLKALCRQFAEQYPNIAVDFKNGGPPTSIPGEVATCLYRIAQESLQNVAKHSGAKNVSVRLGFDKGAVVFTIQDDGAGFDPKAVKGHGAIGLISMRERAHFVKGNLTIRAQPGHGTQVSMEAPLPVGNS
jgi:PAS domain S-box-containing protein